jgi:hypothetical protein
VQVHYDDRIFVSKFRSRYLSIHTRQAGMATACRRSQPQVSVGIIARTFRPLLFRANYLGFAAKREGLQALRICRPTAPIYVSQGRFRLRAQTSTPQWRMIVEAARQRCGSPHLGWQMLAGTSISPSSYARYCDYAIIFFQEITTPPANFCQPLTALADPCRDTRARHRTSRSSTRRTMSHKRLSAD